MDLQGKVVWITGAARRLGRALAWDLAGRGADIVVHYATSEADARHTAGQIEEQGRRALVVQADLARVDQIQACARRIEEHFGRLDVLINNASNFLRVRWEDVAETDWDRSLNANLKGPFFCAQAAAKLMLRGEGGKIINLADTAGLRPVKNFAPYMTAKGGLITLTRVLALELAPRIQVNAVAPGVVLPPPETGEREIEALRRQIPLGRLGSPGDIVATVAFLLEGSDYITGQVLCVDGGRYVAQPKRPD